MTLEEQLNYVQSCSKEEFIAFAKKVNVLRTMKEPNYLAIKDEILSLLSKHDLTIDNIIPDPRIIDTRIMFR